jgi:hypothetical protein
MFTGDPSIRNVRKSTTLGPSPSALSHYAVSFANEVSRQVRESLGVNLGHQNNYYDMKDGETFDYIGILPPME